MNIIDTTSKVIDIEKDSFIVAEIGINHNGDMKIACDAIAAAAEAGADSVKFQNYRTEDFISDRKLMFEYCSQGKKIIEPQFDMFKRCELSRDQLSILKEETDKCGLDFHSTPTSIDGVKYLQEIGCKIIKNGSDYLTHLELIRAMGETGLTTVLSTGMATLTEIDQAVQTYHETGNEKLILLHCTSSYPTPAKDVNLARLATLSSAFGVPVGFSDHSAGTTASIGATILGASWIEKHFTLDRDLPGPDHWFSMDPKELKDLVRTVREARNMIGNSFILPTVSEQPGRRDSRLSCVAKSEIKKGSIIKESDITFRRPGYGFPPKDIQHIVGRKIKETLSVGSVISQTMFD
jgi:N-acetylneuraminate synthase/N,N'-diacetyllegionaminate synthase